MTENPADQHVGTESTASTPTGVSDVGAIKQRAAGTLLPLPSGLVMRCRRVDLQTFVRQGNVPNALMEVVESAISKGKQVDLEKMVDPENLDVKMMAEMFDLIEVVVRTVVVEPKIWPVPGDKELAEWNHAHLNEDAIEDPEELRREDRVYIDEVDDEDKMFLFQWASGGTSDIAQFRREAEADLAAVAEIQGVALSPERSGRHI